MQQGDFNFYYPFPQNPRPPQPTYPQSNSFPPPASASASAPPFSANYGSPLSSDYSTSYPSSYPSYPQNSDPVPSAPSFNTPPQQPQPSSSFPPYETHRPFQPPSPPPYYSTCDQHQVPPPNYTSPTPNSIPKSPYDSVYSAQLNQLSSSFAPVYDTPHDENVKFDQKVANLDDFSARYGSSGRERSDFGSNFYGKSADGGGYGMDGYGDGVYAYQGSKVEPYGARGTAPKSSTWTGFDDFGRPIGFSSDKVWSSGSDTKIARAVPKADTQEDVKSGVQKFRVKLLAESGAQSTMGVLCQVSRSIIIVLFPVLCR